MQGFLMVSRFKRHAVRSGGVVICENENYGEALPSVFHELLKYDKKEIEVKRIPTSDNGG